MRVRRLMWRTAAVPAARAAPRAARAYYEAIVRSMARCLLRVEGVVAVYVAGSYATGGFVPGRSDVDVVAAIDAPTPEAHIRVLAAARAACRRYLAILPIDLSLLPAAEFPRHAWNHTMLRRRIRAPEPRHPVDRWLLMGGPDLRAPVDDPPDARLFRLTDSHAVDAARRLAAGDSAGALAALASTAKDLETEGGDAHALRVDARHALEVAFDLLTEVRERERPPAATERPDVLTWRATTPPQWGVVAAHALVGADLDHLRSATVYVEPFLDRPTVLLEAATAREAVALSETVGKPPPGLGLVVLPSTLAEDPWSTTLRAVALAAAGVHLSGDALAPRLRHPPMDVSLEHARVAAAMLWWRFEAGLLGGRARFNETLLLRLAAYSHVACGGPALAASDALEQALPSLRSRAALDRDALGLLALRLLAQTSSTPPFRIRSGSMSR